MGNLSTGQPNKICTILIYKYSDLTETKEYIIKIKVIISLYFAIGKSLLFRLTQWNNVMGIKKILKWLIIKQSSGPR